MRASVFVAVTRDGFIARADGSVDWLDVPQDNEDYGFAAFMDSVDALVMGRNTFDFVMATGEWVYREKPVIVLTHRPLQIPYELSSAVETSALAPVALAVELDRRSVGHIYVDGGATIQSFLEASLIDCMIITTLPVLIGTGIPLFGPTAVDISLRHVNTVAYSNGLVQTTYDVV